MQGFLSHFFNRIQLRDKTVYTSPILYNDSGPTLLDQSNFQPFLTIREGIHYISEVADALSSATISTPARLHG